MTVVSIACHDNKELNFYLKLTQLQFSECDLREESGKQDHLLISGYGVPAP